jgi:predicted peroxiredoxin
MLIEPISTSFELFRKLPCVFRAYICTSQTKKTNIMNDKRKLVVVITQGLDDERASVAWSMAVGGVGTGLDVSVFLASSGVDWVRKGAADTVHLNPLDPPMMDMINIVRENECTIMVCPPCAKVRGYEENDLIDGCVLAGSAAMHALIQQGAAVISI